MQPFEKINDKWVAYGLGNQIARHEEPRGTTEEGVMARFRFNRGPNGWIVRARPSTSRRWSTWARRSGCATWPRDTSVEPKRRGEALVRTDRVVLSLGAAENGLTRPGE